MFTGAAAVVVVVIFVEASAPKAHSTLLGLAVGILTSGEGLPNLFCLVISSLGHLRSLSVPLCKGDTVSTGGGGGSQEDRRWLSAAECDRLKGA